MTPSKQQEDALAAIKAWHSTRKAAPFFYLAGYAGTGKTTLAKAIAGDVKGKVVFGAFTGKAALVLRSKGCDGASTIHSMIYKPRENNVGVTDFVINREADVRKAKLVIIDECSMVDEKLGADLMSFGVPVLVLGDPAQLPPVGGDGFFTRGAPDFLLTEVHRQAAENLIIRMSMDVREGKKLQRGQYGTSRVVEPRDVKRSDVRSADQVLVGMNKTRRSKNQTYRDMNGRKSFWPEVGERLVCLRNNHDKGLLNGSLWDVHEVREVNEEMIRMVVTPVDAGGVKQAVEVVTHRAFFEGRERELQWHERRDLDEFDFGYVLTCHKAQGSQWDNVIVFDESYVFKTDRQRWLYTAITRAAETVTVAV